MKRVHVRAATVVLMRNVIMGNSGVRCEQTRPRVGPGLLLGAFFVFGAWSGAAADEAPRTPREIFTCEDEQRRFATWSRLAGSSAEGIASQFPNAALATIRMPDDRTIRGVHFRAADRPRGAVLVIQGNAWRAELFARFASTFTRAMLDVFIFDFRGYSLSKPGHPAMKATPSCAAASPTPRSLGDIRFKSNGLRPAKSAFVTYSII